MSREPFGYRETLETILNFSGGKYLLQVKDVQAYTSLNYRTVKKRFPFKDNLIPAAVLAMCLTRKD